MTLSSDTDDPGHVAVERSAAGPFLHRTSLSHLRFSVLDVEASVEFYERIMGLVRRDPPANVAARLGWGSGHHVLDLVAGAPGLEAFAYEVRDSGGVAQLARGLSDRGLDITEIDGEFGGSVALRDPDGTLVEFHGPVSRSGEHTADTGRRPIRVQHVTLATANMDAMVDFYTGLGLRVTDRMGTVFTWLRSNVEHHSLAIVKAPSAGIDHYSYDVAGWDDIKVWCDRLADLDVPVTWGPGRHGPGNNLFIFFDDPDGNRVELSAEMERFWDDRATYATRVWEPTPATINLWGGQLASWRTSH